jgi:hypothetical protein
LQKSRTVLERSPGVEGERLFRGERLGMFLGSGKEMFWGLGEDLFQGLREDLFQGLREDLFRELGEEMFWDVVNVFRYISFARFIRWNSIYKFRGMKTFLMLLQLPLVDHLALEVQLVHVQVHHVHCSTCTQSRRLSSKPFKKILVRGWDASSCPHLADRLGRGCSFVVVCFRPYHSTGVFRWDRTGQSSIARSKRTRDPVLSANQSGVVDRKQTK